VEVSVRLFLAPFFLICFVAAALCQGWLPLAIGPLGNSLVLVASSSQYLSAVGKTSCNAKIFSVGSWVRLTAFTGADTYTWFTAGNNITNSNNVKLTNANNGTIIINGRTGGSVVINIQTTAALLTDTNWHFLLWGVDTTQAVAANRVAIEFDGTPAALTTTTAPPQNQNLALNLTGNSSIGASLASGPTTPTTPFNGKMAQYYYIDGQKLPSSNFITGTPGVPKTFSGSYTGACDTFLPFSNASALGADNSGEGNNFTPINGPTQSTDYP
jgi:hypothetical protein